MIKGKSRPVSSAEQRLWTGITRELAHQMGTPLSALMGWVDVLPSLKDPQVALKEMNQNLERLRLITERLGTVAEPVKFEVFPLGELLTDIEVFIRKRLPGSRSGIGVSVEVKPAITVYGSRNLLQWALECLAKNALDALEGITGQIILTSREREGGATLEMTDSGRGIPVEIQGRIFDPGFSTKPSGQGMGLAVVKHIVERGHGGKVELTYSQPSRGTKFTITL